jgi:ribonuclease R
MQFKSRVDRLTLSVSMEIDGKRKVINQKSTKAVIHSKARMVYGDVSDMLKRR